MKRITLTALVLLALSQVHSSADEYTDVKPYGFASVDSGVIVYKMVHQGCTLYLATGPYGGYSSAPVAITTGRGCK